MFGCLRNGIVHLSKAGEIAETCWLAIPAHFPNAILDSHTVQPDHLHGIITIRAITTGPPVGAQHVAPLQVPRPMVAGSLPVIVRSYKAAVTRLLNTSTSVWRRG